MLSKESKTRDAIIAKIVDNEIGESDCFDLVGSYLSLVRLVEMNRKFYDLTTLFLNQDQRLLLQTFIFLKVREENVANYYLFEFLDLYHKKAV